MMPSVSAPNSRDLELCEMPSISSQMPVSFAIGSEWSEFNGFCIRCDQLLADAIVRGLVVRHSEKMASVEAVGLCTDCSLLSRFLYRLHDDMRLTGPKDGVWRTWSPRRPPLLSRLASLFGRLKRLLAGG